MKQNETYRRIGATGYKLRRRVAAAAMLLTGIVIGSVVSPPPAAHGEVQPGPPPQAFQSGGQLSLPLLRDIGETLHQIDARLARLEVVARQLQQQSH